MTLLFILRGWGVAFVSWLREPIDPSYRARKERQAKARRAMQRELWGRR